MNNKNNLPDYEYIDDEIDLMELFGDLWLQKRLIIVSTLIASFIAVIYSLSLPNIYVSKAVLSPTQQSGDLGSSLRGVSGLASLAGISLPSASSSNEIEAIETLSSFKFDLSFISSSIHFFL